MQERSHAFAMKSQIWLLDPRPNLPSHRRGGEARLRAVGGQQHAGDAAAAHPRLPRARAVRRRRQRAAQVHAARTRWTTPQRDVGRIVLPPASFVHEQEKVRERWPAAVRFIEERRLNEFFAEDADDIGVIVQGGSYNTLMRALERLGLADVYGNSKVPLYVMNVAYPVIDSEVLRFCEGKRAVLLVEEGQPNFIEQNIATMLRQAGMRRRAARQGHAAGGRRIHRRRAAEGRAHLLRAL